MKHERSVYTWLQILSDYGGLVDLFLFPFIFLNSKFNEVQLDAKIIRSIFFQKKRNLNKSVAGGDLQDANMNMSLNPQNIGKVEVMPIKFTIWDKFNRNILVNIM